MSRWFSAASPAASLMERQEPDQQAIDKQTALSAFLASSPHEPPCHARPLRPNSNAIGTKIMSKNKDEKCECGILLDSDGFCPVCESLMEESKLI